MLTGMTEELSRRVEDTLSDMLMRSEAEAVFLEILESLEFEIPENPTRGAGLRTNLPRESGLAKKNRRRQADAGTPSGLIGKTGRLG